MKRNLAKYDDANLLQIMRDSNEQSNIAFSELYDRYAVKVRSFCNYMISSKDQVEDTFQETFIFFFRNITAGKDVTNTLGYLLSIARNLCLKYYRDKKSNVPYDGEAYFIDERNEYEQNEMLDIVVRSLDLLEDIYREAFVLREFEGLHYDEIAKVTNTTVTNAKSRVFRAHKQLIKVLDPYLKDLSKKY